MREWFAQLAPRERMLVSIAAALAVFTLIVTLGIAPIIRGTTKGHERVAEKRELLFELDRVAERVGPQTGGSGVATGDIQSLVVIVDRTTRDSGLAPYLKRNQPDGADSIRLRLENAPFDAVIEWLSIIKNRHGMSAIAANIDTTSAAGRVNCNLTLSRSGG